MSDGWSAAAQSLGRMGGTLVESALTINEIDARQKSDAAELEIASRIEAFKRGLLSDPDHGTPGQQDGYMAKWKDEVSGIDEMIQGIDNPLARRAVQSSFSRIAANQTTAVYSLQHQAWGKATVAQRLDMIRQRAETSGLPVQDQLNLAAEDLDFLVGSNLLDRYERDKLLSDWSQVIMERDLSARAKEAYALGGLPAAKKLLLDDSEIYTAGGSPYRASDTVKASALNRVEAMAAASDEEANEALENAWSNLVSANPAGIPSNARASWIKTVEDTRTSFGLPVSANLQYTWKQRVEIASNAAETAKGTYLSDMGRAALDELEAAKITWMNEGARVGTTPAVRIMGTDSRYYDVEVSPEGIKKASQNSALYAAFAAVDGGLQRLAKLASEWKPTGAGAAIFDDPELKEIFNKDPGLRLEADTLLRTSTEADYPKLKQHIVDAAKGKVARRISGLTTGAFAYKHTGDPIDEWTRMIDGGEYKYYVADGKILLKPVRDRYYESAAEFQRFMETQGIKTGPMAISPEGRPYFDVTGGFSAPKDQTVMGPYGPSTRKLGTPQRVRLTTRGIGVEGDARPCVDIDYGNGLVLSQAFESIGGVMKWVDIKQGATAWQYVDIKTIVDAAKVADMEQASNTINQLSTYGALP